MQTIPIVKDELGRSWDIGSALLQQRIIFLNGEINEQQAEAIISALLYLDAQPGDEPINLYINSPGGVVTAGLAIYDTMQYIKCDVSTICMGMAASMGAFLLASGTKGKRFALPNAEIMIHQPLIGGQGGGLSGQTTDIKIHAEHMVYIRDKMNRMLSEYTGQPLEKILRNMIRVCFLRPRQRPYKTKNFYAVIMRQNQLDREVYHIVNGKAKTDPRREKAGRSRHRQGEPDR